VSDLANQKKTDKGMLIHKLLPFSLTTGILIVDQLTKLLIVLFLPLHKSVSILGNLLLFTHVRNKAIAFGIGKSLPIEVQQVLFFILPLCVVVFLIVFLIRAKDIKPIQRWTLCAIVGGGLGNIIDRIFRPGGVVDFIDMDFFDIKLFDIIDIKRWPTYNIADSTIVVGIVILIVSMIIEEVKTKKKGLKNE
jgi:signal peptidase II